MIRENTAIPWHMICELWTQGRSIDELAKRFNVPQKEIQRRLDVAVSSSGYVRTNAEINLCSNHVKCDLVAVLIRLVRQLDNQHTDPDKSINRLDRLTTIAAKLFSWPSAKAIDVRAISDSSTNQAINPRLINTPPHLLSDNQDAA